MNHKTALIFFATLFLACFLLVVPVTALDTWNGSINTSWYSPPPTTYTLTKAEELAGVAELVNSGTNFNGKTIKLGDDIDLACLNWTAIGNGSSTSFQGNFDGSGYTISNLYINNSTEDYQGLFGYMWGDLNPGISNVTLLNVSVSGKDNVGGVLGMAAVNITNCSVSGNVSGNKKIGGVAGYVSGIVTNSSASVNVTATDERAGGLAGEAWGGTIINSNATGNVSGITLVGGLVGFSFNNNIMNSYATGNVSGDNYIGGLVGSLEGISNITNSYATGNVSGTAELVGGLVGKALGSITNSYATGSVDGGIHNTGGLIGQMSGNITNSTASGSVSGTNSVGGFVGYAKNNCNITNSTASGNVTASYYAGGFAGYAENNCNIINSYATGSVSGNYYIGGIAGYVESNCNITNSYATGNVNGDNYIGGITGFAMSASSITNTSALNQYVNGSFNVGRVLGGTGGATVINSYAWAGIISGKSSFSSTAENGISVYADQIWNISVLNTPPWDNFSDTIWAVNNTFTGYLLPVFIWQKKNPAVNVVFLSDTRPVREFPSGGFGTDEYPYRIASASDLANVSTLVDTDPTNFSACSYLVIANINLSGYAIGDGWDPIGNNANHFTGNFDGGGYTIENLYINRDEDYQGLFGYLDGSSISNITLTNVSVTTGAGTQYIGGVIGYADGIAIKQVYATGNINGESVVGGLIGDATDSTVNNSCFIGDVNGTSSSIGGLIGSGGFVTDSYAAGTVKGGTDVGGLVGTATGDIINSYAAGNVSGTNVVGGLVGNTVGGGNRILNSTSLTQYINATNNDLGRVVGVDGGTTLNNNYAWENSQLNGVVALDDLINGTSVTSGAIWNKVALPSSSPPWNNFSTSWMVNTTFTTYLLPVFSWQTTSPLFNANYLTPVTPPQPAPISPSSDGGGDALDITPMPTTPVPTVEPTLELQPPKVPETDEEKDILLPVVIPDKEDPQDENSENPSVNTDSPDNSGETSFRIGTTTLNNVDTTLLYINKGEESDLSLIVPVAADAAAVGALAATGAAQSGGLSLWLKDVIDGLIKVFKTFIEQIIDFINKIRQRRKGGKI